MKVNILCYNKSGGAYNAAYGLFKNLNSFGVNTKIFSVRKSMNKLSLDFIKFLIFLLRKRLMNKKDISNFQPYFPLYKVNNSLFDCDILILEWLGNGSFPNIKELVDFKGKLIIHHHDEMYINSRTFTYFCPDYSISDNYSFKYNLLKLEKLRDVSHVFVCKHNANLSPFKTNHAIHNFSTIDVKNYSHPVRKENNSDQINIGLAAFRGLTEKRKGLFRLINYLKFFKKKTIIHLVGDKKITEIKLNNKTKLMSYGHLSRDGMKLFWEKIDFLVVPSFADSYPNVCIEAAVNQVPVLVSHDGGQKESLHYINGIASSFDPLNCNDEIKRLLKIKQVIDIENMHNEIFNQWNKIFHE